MSFRAKGGVPPVAEGSHPQFSVNFLTLLTVVLFHRIPGAIFLGGYPVSKYPECVGNPLVSTGTGYRRLGCEFFCWSRLRIYLEVLLIESVQKNKT
ncbi:MAG: hypothetical protein R3281_18290 [Balneolaceae bacterium]|nr:hypothetical protein [Balneolaceae bacterium]